MNNRFNVLDIFRGLFASAVFLFHLSPFAPVPLLQNSFTTNADMFVDFFFVLSGFVIAHRYEQMSDMQQFRNFYKKRFLRIYPLHIIVLLAFVLIEVAKHLLASRIQVNNLDNPANSISSFLSNALLLQSTPVFGVKDVSWNIASWSISAEMIAYLIFGLVLVAIHHMGWYGKRVLVYVVLLVAAVAGLIVITGGYELNYTFNYGFLRGLIGFFAGVICLNLYRRTAGMFHAVPQLFFSITEVLVLGLTFLAICRGEMWKSFGLIYVLLFLACIYVFAFEKGILSKWLNRAPVLYKMGVYSYSIYMWHTLFISLFNVLFIRIFHLPPSAYVWLVVLNYLVIFFVAKWSYTHIEMRFMGKK